MTQYEIIEMLRQAGFQNIAGGIDGLDELIAFAKLVEAKASAKEREACLKICEAQAQTNYWEGADVCAEAIRARSGATSRGEA
jgi:hypothetical protein